MISITRQYIKMFSSPDFSPYVISSPLNLLRTGSQVDLPPVPEPLESLGPEPQLGDHLF